MMQVEELRTYLPKYLSEVNYQTLLNELESFPDNIDRRIYTTFLDKNILFQGDGYDSFPVVDLAHLEKGHKYAPGIIMSNTCDIDLSNKRYYPSFIMFAPIISLEKYRSVLRSNEITEDKINNHLSEVRRQKITSILYLPADSRIQESIVFLDKMYNIENHFIDRNTLAEHRLFSLSDYGFYLFLFKLSVHFSRIKEGINRGHQ